MRRYRALEKIKRESFVCRVFSFGFCGRAGMTRFSELPRDVVVYIVGFVDVMSARAFILVYRLACRHVYTQPPFALEDENTKTEQKSVECPHVLMVDSCGVLCLPRVKCACVCCSTQRRWKPTMCALRWQHTACFLRAARKNPYDIRDNVRALCKAFMPPRAELVDAVLEQVRAVYSTNSPVVFSLDLYMTYLAYDTDGGRHWWPLSTSMTYYCDDNVLLYKILRHGGYRSTSAWKAIFSSKTSVTIYAPLLWKRLPRLDDNIADIILVIDKYMPSASPGRAATGTASGGRVSDVVRLINSALLILCTRRASLWSEAQRRLQALADDGARLCEGMTCMWYANECELEFWAQTSICSEKRLYAFRPKYEFASMCYVNDSPAALRLYDPVKLLENHCELVDKYPALIKHASALWVSERLRLLDTDVVRKHMTDVLRRKDLQYALAHGMVSALEFMVTKCRMTLPRHSFLAVLTAKKLSSIDFSRFCKLLPRCTVDDVCRVMHVLSSSHKRIHRCAWVLEYFFQSCHPDDVKQRIMHAFFYESRFARVADMDVVWNVLREHLKTCVMPSTTRNNKDVAFRRRRLPPRVRERLYYYAAIAQQRPMERLLPSAP